MSTIGPGSEFAPPPDKVKHLTHQQVRFCQEYMVDGKAQRAYIAAGYSPGGARQNAHAMLKNYSIMYYLDKLRADQAVRTMTTSDRIVAEMARIAFSDVRNIVNDDGSLKRIEDLDKDTAAAVVSVKVIAKPVAKEDGGKVYEEVIEYKFGDKRAALETLGKNHRLWVDRVESDNTHRIAGLSEALNEMEDSTNKLPSHVEDLSGDDAES